MGFSFPRMHHDSVRVAQAINERAGLQIDCSGPSLAHSLHCWPRKLLLRGKCKWLNGVRSFSLQRRGETVLPRLLKQGDFSSLDLYYYIPKLFPEKWKIRQNYERQSLTAAQKSYSQFNHIWPYLAWFLWQLVSISHLNAKSVYFFQECINYVNQIMFPWIKPIVHKMINYCD